MLEQDVADALHGHRSNSLDGVSDESVAVSDRPSQTRRNPVKVSEGPVPEASTAFDDKSKETKTLGRSLRPPFRFLGRGRLSRGVARSRRSTVAAPIDRHDGRTRVSDDIGLISPHLLNHPVWARVGVKHDSGGGSS